MFASSIDLECSVMKRREEEKINGKEHCHYTDVKAFCNDQACYCYLPRFLARHQQRPSMVRNSRTPQRLVSHPSDSFFASYFDVKIIFSWQKSSMRDISMRHDSFLKACPRAPHLLSEIHQARNLEALPSGDC